ncbi:TIGR01212 family radical SAM protein [Eubacterium sp. MSJ-13]|uniref:TIGR01212 family radical SAM protein n=1 Tax=Eubacterium sp. MSJ-13 TaxID=2841513 RepID=UPI001C12235A|nr:TIGR01212 family radical SAM protein [Eubacterium sp. MSJ-13]MBU5478290.1 TIGR01212 family radical SAM protein [Eubacterium sp. MSJ-13]
MKKNEHIRRWGEKPYYSLDYHLKKTFGEKVYKVALDGGMSCPNRDGTVSTGGCIFCSNGGSGDFAIKHDSDNDITKQIESGINSLKANGKFVGEKFIAYFQSFSNTYAPVSYLENIFSQAINHPLICALSIATRPDCFNEEIYDLIDRLNHIKPVWIELGLQTMHEETSALINRGYTLNVFEETVHELRKRNITVIVHVIIGLPHETESDFFKTIAYLNTMDIQGIKLQLLHVLKNTALAGMIGNFHILTQDEYIDILCGCIARLSPDIVIHRLTGDGPKDLLIAPEWSKNKRLVLNTLSHELKVRGIYQGQNFRNGGF